MICSQQKSSAFSVLFSKNMLNFMDIHELLNFMFQKEDGMLLTEIVVAVDGYTNCADCDYFQVIIPLISFETIQICVDQKYYLFN